MKQTRHASNLIYRQVADQLGFKLLREEQAAFTGKPVSMNTVKRYYGGYGDKAIPTPGFEAALRLTSAMFLVAQTFARDANRIARQHNARVYGQKSR